MSPTLRVCLDYRDRGFAILGPAGLGGHEVPTAVGREVRDPWGRNDILGDEGNSARYRLNRSSAILWGVLVPGGCRDHAGTLVEAIDTPGCVSHGGAFFGGRSAVLAAPVSRTTSPTRRVSARRGRPHQPGNRPVSRAQPSTSAQSQIRPALRRATGSGKPSTFESWLELAGATTRAERRSRSGLRADPTRAER